MPTDGFQRRKTDRLGLAGFENGQVLGRYADDLCQIIGFDLTAGEHDIQANSNGHEFLFYGVYQCAGRRPLNGKGLFLLKFSGFIHHPGNNRQNTADK